MKNQKSIESMTCTEIFQTIAQRQVLALMFHDQMCDLYDFLSLQGFKRLHRHQYLSESEEFLNVKQYFMTAHNKLLDIGDTGQPEKVIPENWYGYTRLDVTPQIVKQNIELSFKAYKTWEEDTKRMYEACSKALFDMGLVADSEEVNRLIKDVSKELELIYDTMLRLKASGYDIVYTLELQDWFKKKYK